MAAAPPFLTLRDNRDDRGRVELLLRRAVLGILALFLLAALLNVFGQGERHSAAAGAVASLAVSAPDRLRGGLMYQARIRVRAERSLAAATLVLDRGWAEGMHVNTIVPAPEAERSRDGLLALELGPLDAGEETVLWLQLQVNPTNVGRRPQNVRLYDGDELLAEVDRTVTVFP